MSLLLKVLGGGVGPYLVGVVATALLSLTATVVWQRVTVADLKTDVAVCAVDRVELKGKVELQNREVERLAKQCRAQSLTADLAAKEVLHRPPTAAPGTGPAEMNRWFAQRLRQPR